MKFKFQTTLEDCFRKAQQHVRMVVTASVLYSVAVTCLAGTFVYFHMQRIYVLADAGTVYTAMAEELDKNRPVEARAHVARFHELFFTLSPDNSAIEENIKRALHLADKTPYEFFKDWKEKGYYNRIISGDIHQRIEVDTVKGNFEKEPYEATVFCRQLITRDNRITERSLVTKCRLESSGRSPVNPHGFLIRNFEIVSNRDIRTVKK